MYGTLCGYDYWPRLCFHLNAVLVLILNSCFILYRLVFIASFLSIFALLRIYLFLFFSIFSLLFFCFSLFEHNRINKKNRVDGSFD